jgi:hypothetical protein
MSPAQLVGRYGELQAGEAGEQGGERYLGF